MNAREQLGKLSSRVGHVSRLKKFLKRLTRRAERRDAKLLDEAPPRHWKGYAD